MEDRDFTEVDLRAMLERATTLREDIVEGRFVIETHLRGWPWAVIVEPDPIDGLLVVNHRLYDRLMRQRYLEVTFRRGKPLAAYLYLPRAARAKVARTTDEGSGIRVDFDADGTPMGIEISSPGSIAAEQMSALLARLGQPDVPIEEWAPLRAA